jgi:hypothetical protein
MAALREQRQCGVEHGIGGDGGRVSAAAYATLYWNASLTWLWREEPCRSRFWEPGKSARY